MRNFLLAGLLAAGSMFSAPVFQVIPTLGPDNFNSPTSFNGWAFNVIQNLINPANPDGVGVRQYIPLSNGALLQGGEFIDSSAGGFDSWQGTTPGPFAGELGTALFFSVVIKDTVGQFSLSQLNVSEIFLGQSGGTYQIGGDYRQAAIGIDTVNGILYNSGPGTALVNELYYIGVGFVQPLDNGIVGTPQQKLDGTKLQVQQLADRTTNVCYFLSNSSNPTDRSNCGNVDIQGTTPGNGNGVPEPGSMVLLGLGLAGVAYLRRKQ